jgi:hypothetical protein
MMTEQPNTHERDWFIFTENREAVIAALEEINRRVDGRCRACRAMNRPANQLRRIHPA